LAGAAFKDAETVELLSNFTPILVDGDVEKEVVAKYNVRGYPNTLFANAKGEVVKTVTGAMETPAFRKAVEDALKDVGKPRPSKDYKTLSKAEEELNEALEKDKVKQALGAIAKIEKVGRDCSITDRALAAKKKLLDAGLEAVAAAEKTFADGDADAASKALKSLLRDYKGADTVEDAARKVLDAI
jgi:flagellar hook-length control protein FliK